MRLQVLYFDGCPGHEQLMPAIRTLAEQHGADLEEIRITGTEHAEAERFLGSPTVRMDGKDVDPGAAGRTDYGMKCRLYRSPAGQSGIPPREWIDRALRAARPAAPA